METEAKKVFLTFEIPHVKCKFEDYKSALKKDILIKISDISIMHKCFTWKPEVERHILIFHKK